MAFWRSLLSWSGTNEKVVASQYLGLMQLQNLEVSLKKMVIVMKWFSNSKFAVHDILYLQVDLSVDPSFTRSTVYDGIRWIKAEKGDAGITLNLEHYSNSDGPTLTHRKYLFEFDCKGIHVRSRALINLLKEHDPTYNVLSSNCWKYAHDCFKIVLEQMQREMEAIPKAPLSTGEPPMGLEAVESRMGTETSSSIDSFVEELPDVSRDTEAVRYARVSIAEHDLLVNDPGTSTLSLKVITKALEDLDDIERPLPIDVLLCRSGTQKLLRRAKICTPKRARSDKFADELR